MRTGAIRGTRVWVGAWFAVAAFFALLSCGTVERCPAAAAAPVAPPADAELKKLVTQTLLDFNAAVQQKDFAAFHAAAASPLMNKYTPDQLREAFGNFIQKNVNLAGIARTEPEFSARPQVDEAGVLSAAGIFPTNPYRVTFALKYVREQETWKVLAISVDVKPLPAPPPEQLRALVTRTLLEFGTAVKARDFTAFRQSVAPALQEQFSADRLRESFQEFCEKQVDLSAVHGTEPAFDGDPVMEAGPVLSLQGHYDLPAMVVTFKLKYVQDKDQWRLLAINVKTKPKE